MSPTFSPTPPSNHECGRPRTSSMAQRQASVFFPLMFMAHEPQIPSRQDLRNVNVGSCGGECSGPAREKRGSRGAERGRQAGTQATVQEG